MFSQGAGGEAHRKGGESSTIELGLSQLHDPKQGARLVRAFLGIRDPRIRLAIVEMVEKLESAPSDH